MNTTTPENMQAATDRFLVGMSALCDRLYNEAINKGATDEQAIKAVRLTLVDFMEGRND